MTIGIQVVVQDNRYDPIFGGQQIYRVKRELKSQPVTINVKEFPKGAPASFNGAVGSFSLSSTMPAVEIDANSADQIELTLSGKGNFKFITAPRVAFPESFEVYDTKCVDNSKLTATGASGSITYTYPFVARSAGTFTIPSVEFTYFDPSTETYTTLSTEAFTIEVKDDGSVMSEVSPRRDTVTMVAPCDSSTTTYATSTPISCLAGQCPHLSSPRYIGWRWY